MVRNDLRQSLLAGKTPKNVRLLIARGLAPVPAADMLDLLICLLKDPDPDIALQSVQTIAGWDEEEIITLLRQKDCPPSVLEYYANSKSPERMIVAIIANPASPGESIASLASTVAPHLLESILDNRTRILAYPQILDGIRRNSSATAEILRLASEIEVEFMGSKRKEYSIAQPVESPVDPPFDAIPAPSPVSEMESEIDFLISEAPLEDLSLEGLPADEDQRETAITSRLSSMPVREKIRYALFGSREIRAMLVRDTNKEIARAVLRSPKLRENEVESIAGMRNVAEEILREIGNNREWTKSYTIVQSLVKNPKTPPLISQRLMFRLRSQELTLMTRDRSIPDAVRHNATRLLKQRAAKGSG